MSSILDSHTSETLYRQLADKIRDDIHAGKYKIDEQIPTEFELTDIYNVSRSTVRKAIDLLVTENLLIKIHGKGTFVAPPQVRHTSDGFYSTTQSMESIGKTVSSKVIYSAVVDAETDVVNFFNPSVEKLKVVRIQRTRYLDGSPLCLETISLPMKYLSILEEDLTNSLYEILDEKYSIIPSDGEKCLQICYARDDESKELDVPRNSALMLIKDSVKDQYGCPLYVSKQVHAGEMIKYGMASVQFFKLKN